MSNPTNRRGTVVLMLALASLAPPLAAQGISCHIHPPGSTPERPRNTVGPFDSVAGCEHQRVTRFGAAGRCHCAADFSPSWIPQPEPFLPGGSPLG
jgi:hypothetical protein